jgi:putative flippase GtrA
MRRIVRPIRSGTPSTVQALLKQFSRFFGVGVIAAVVHYGLLIGLVEIARVAVVPATLAGYVAGGVASYLLNRRLTYTTTRGDVAASWRFALVAGVGFLITGAIMHVFVDRWGAPYLPAQLVTTGIVLIWSFFAHKWFSFGERAG